MSSCSRRSWRAASSLSASRLLSAVPTVRSYSGPNRSCNLLVRRRASACQTRTPSTTTTPIATSTQTHEGMRRPPSRSRHGSISQISTTHIVRRIRRIHFHVAAVVGSSMSSQTQLRQARRGGEKVARSDAFELFARAGFVARGLIYGIIGILAFKLAIGAGGKAASQQGALETIAHQAFGQVLLILVAIGLAGYACWRFVRAFLGHGAEASDSGLDRVTAFAS